MFPPGVLKLAHDHSISPPSSSRTRSTVACVPRTYFFSSGTSICVVIGREKTRNSRGPSEEGEEDLDLDSGGEEEEEALGSCEDGCWVEEEGETTTEWVMKDRSVAPNGSL